MKKDGKMDFQAIDWIHLLVMVISLFFWYTYMPLPKKAEAWLINSKLSSTNIKKQAISEFVDIVYEATKDDLTDGPVVVEDMSNKLMENTVNYVKSVNRGFGTRIFYEDMVIDIKHHSLTKITSNIDYYLGKKRS